MDGGPVLCNGFVLCYEKYYNQVMRFIMRYISNYHDIEELTQDVFMKVFEKGKNLDPESGSVKKFIFTIARNRAFDFIKNSKREMEKLKEAHFEEAVMDDTFFRNIEDLYIEGELISAIQETLDSFNKREKAVYLESVYKGKRKATVSREMNISIYKMKKIVNGMNSVLREKITPYR